MLGLSLSSGCSPTAGAGGLEPLGGHFSPSSRGLWASPAALGFLAACWYRGSHVAYRCSEASWANIPVRRVAAVPPFMAQPQKSQRAISDILCWSKQPRETHLVSRRGGHRPSSPWKERRRIVDISKKHRSGPPQFCMRTPELFLRAHHAICDFIFISYLFSV